ncbi:MAG: hypothetical protein AB1478_05445 [Nitrospirota bacterium]
MTVIFKDECLGCGLLPPSQLFLGTIRISAEGRILGFYCDSCVSLGIPAKQTEADIREASWKKTGELIAATLEHPPVREFNDGFDWKKIKENLRKTCSECRNRNECESNPSERCENGKIKVYRIIPG